MKTVITLAVAFILGLGVAAGTIGCGGDKPKTPAAPADKMEEKKPDAAPATPAPADKKEDEKK